MTGSQSVADFSSHTCSAPAERSDRMRDIVLEHARDGEVRVLDVGCGTGSLAIRLADALPSASIVGIDVSSANIAAAQRSSAERALASRIDFRQADYLQWSSDPFDVIVSDGVLHLIRADSDVLVRKIAGDLLANGTFICAMPFDCAYNRAFAIVRRALAAVRSPATDAVILQAARLLHRDQMDDRALRERVGYMYLPPQRMMGRNLARQFEAAGLRLVARHAMPSTSPSQLKHDVTVWRRETAVR